MRFSDKILIAFKSIGKNKSRSILTLIIVWIIGFVVLGIAAIGTSVSKTTEVSIKNNFYNKEHEIIGRTQLRNLLSDTYSRMIYEAALKENENHINHIIISEYVMDFRYYNDDFLQISEGQMPNKDISNKNYIYLHDLYKDEYKIGDICKLYNGNTEFIVNGFFSFGEDKWYYIDYEYALYNKLEGIQASYITLCVDDDANLDKTMKSINKLVGVMKQVFEYTNTELDQIYSSYCNKHLYTFLFFGVAIVFLLLTIGSISNMIIISMNENKKLYGLLKALGASDQDIFWISLLEGFIIIFIGVIMSFITLYITKPIVEGLVIFSIDNLVGYAINYGGDITYICNIPMYLPILFSVLFLVLSFAFSGFGVIKIAKKNPIEIINDYD